MDITRIQIKNLLSLSSVEIKPGKVNQIVGANNVGKTTILKAIQLGLQGTTDGSVVKHGEDQAEIVIEFSDDRTVRRVIKKDGDQSVSIRNKDGSKSARPQEILDNLISDNAFNPLDLLDPKRRTEALLKCIPIEVDEAGMKAALEKLSPIDVPPLDYKQHGLKVAESAHKYFYQRRYEAAKIAKEKRATYEIKEKELPAPTPEEPLPSKTDLAVEIDAAESALQVERERYSLHKERTTQLTALEKQRSDNLERGARLEEQIRAAQEALGKVQEASVSYDRYIADHKKKIEDVVPDQTKIEAAQKQKSNAQLLLTQIAERDALNQKRDYVASVRVEAEKSQEFWQALENTVVYLGKPFQEELMAKAELPVPNLTYTEGQFFLDGSSIDNLSSSKSMRLAIAIARKLAGPAKIICLDGAELLDPETYEALRAEIENDGFTYFITKVGVPFDHPGDTVTKMEAGMQA